MNILFAQPQPCIRTLKYAAGLRNHHPKIRLHFAYTGKTLNALYGRGDELFSSWISIRNETAAELRRYVRRCRINLIHSHNGPDTLANLFIDLFKDRIPIVHDIHDLMSLRRTAYEEGLGLAKDEAKWRAEEKKAVEGSDAIITVSREILNILRDYYYRLPRITEVYANYIPEAFVPKNLPKKKTAQRKGPLRIVYEGSLSADNGHYDLRQIFWEIAQQGYEVHIHPSRKNKIYHALSKMHHRMVCHRPCEPQKLFKQITRYDFGWSGFNDALNARHLDTVLPNKMFEYLACGLPVISFQHKAMKSFLEQHRVGLVINGIDELNNCIENANLADLRDNVVQKRWNFTVEDNIGRVVEIYQNLCG